MQKAFGKNPSGKRLEHLMKSPNYRSGIFQNLQETRMIGEGVNYFGMTRNYLAKGIDRQPSRMLPSVKTDLKNLPDTDSPTVVWFGHSSYFLKVRGKNILVDPVFSLRTSPIQSIGMKAYPIETPYSVDDFPTIDALIITHDHYDHLDYNTLVKLKIKVSMVYTSLGVGEHLEYWGFDSSRVIELDWWQSQKIQSDIELIATPARHFSGRSLIRNRTLWSSFVLRAGDFTLFLGGDSGYDKAFKEIGTRFGPFDLAILECGQYNIMWPNIHMMPEETIQAGVDLGAKLVLPVHWGKFTLSLHPWREPIQRASKAAFDKGVSIATPLVGEPFTVTGTIPQKKWWEEIP